MILEDRRIVKRLPQLVSIEESENVDMETLITQVNPDSLDLTIGSKIMRPNGYLKPITVGEPYETERYWTMYDESDKGYITLKRGELILAVTREYLTMPDNLCGHIMLKSSTGRLFLEHMLAGLVDAGYHGRPTLELVNMSPVDLIIPVGCRVAQIEFCEMKAGASLPYSMRKTSRYIGAIEPEAAKAVKHE